MIMDSLNQTMTEECCGRQGRDAGNVCSRGTPCQTQSAAPDHTELSPSNDFPADEVDQSELQVEPVRSPDSSNIFTSYTIYLRINSQMEQKLTNYKTYQITTFIY